MSVDRGEFGQPAPYLSVYERVAQISSPDLTPNEQWYAIEDIQQGPPGDDPEDIGRLRRYEDDPADIATALIDFALAPESTDSTLVRGYALEQGLLRLRRAIEDDPTVRLRVREDIGFHYMELEDGLRDLFDNNLRSELYGGHHPDIAPARREQIEVYRESAFKLAELEGLDWKGTLKPRWDMSEFETYSTPTFFGIPLLPMLLMEYHAGNTTVMERMSSPLAGYISPPVFRDMMLSVLNPNRNKDVVREMGDKNAAGDAGNFAQLSRYVRSGGREHTAPLDFLYDLDPDERREYVRELNQMYENGELLGSMFPAADPQVVALGFHKVVANGLFALEHHIKNGETTAEELQLLGGSSLPVEYKGKELLDSLQQSSLIRLAGEVISHPDTEVVLAVDEPSFVIYAFQNRLLPHHPRVMKYIRPEGGFDINYRYEYGSRRFGVQASSDLRIDAGAPLRPDRPYHKSSLSPQALSIRLDREGRDPRAAASLAGQNPIREQGAVSLDVGSIMDPGLGGRVGRLLAWGNVLRSQSIGEPQRLNHISEVFSTKLGTASEFKAMSLQEIAFWEKRRAAQQGEDYRPASVAAGLALTAS